MARAALANLCNQLGLAVAVEAGHLWAGKQHTVVLCMIKHGMKRTGWIMLRLQYTKPTYTTVTWFTGSDGRSLKAYSMPGECLL